MTKNRIVNKPLPIKNFVDPKELKKLKTLLGIIIAAFAFILYAQSIDHNYTLDDRSVIIENNITTMGIAGIPTILKTDYWYGYKNGLLRGPIYRPTSKIIFAIVWQFSPNSPHIYHFINVLFYAISCLVLFIVLCELFKKQNLLFPFICSLLYAAHPIHTEVVNNIKSLDEILCFLFGMTSIWFILRYLSSKSIFALIVGGVSFYLAMISKETGITFLIIIPLVVYFFTEPSLKKNISIFLILLVFTGIYLIVRMIVFKDLPQNTGVASSVLNNTLNAAPDFISRQATVFYILLRYLVLLIFPHPLTCDYNYAQIKIQTLNDPAVMLGILLYAGLSFYSLMNLHKKSIIAFGFLYYIITLSPVSNIFFLGGSTMAERFMYIPSLGFCIVLTYLLIKLTKTERIKNKFRNLGQFISLNSTVLFFAFTIVCLYSIKTFSRNIYWRDNLTIFSHDVKISTNSASANGILGISLVRAVKDSPNSKNRTDTLNIAKSYLKRALEIYPAYPYSLSQLGEIYYSEGNFDSAYYYQKKELEAHQDDVNRNFNFAKTLSQLKKYNEAIKVLNHVIVLSPKHEDAYFDLALAYIDKGNLEKGLYCFTKVIELNPNHYQAYINRGTLYYNEKRYEEAIRNFSKAIETNSHEAVGFYSRAWSEYYLGEKDAACADMKQAANLGYKPAADASFQICN